VGPQPWSCPAAATAGQESRSRDTALAYGLGNCGLITPGLRAALNVVDFDRLRVRLPPVICDLPAGGKRVLQRAEGYDHTFVTGVEAFPDSTRCDAKARHAEPIASDWRSDRQPLAVRSSRNSDPGATQLTIKQSRARVAATYSRCRSVL